MSASLFRVAGVTVFAAASVAAGLPGAAQAAPGDRTVTITIENDSSSQVTLKASRVSEGRWTQKPPQVIKVSQSGAFQSENSANTGGTSGTVTYKSKSGNIRIYWNNPWVGDNEFTCTAPEDVWCLLGNVSTDDANPDVTITLKDV